MGARYSLGVRVGDGGRLTPPRNEVARSVSEHAEFDHALARDAGHAAAVFLDADEAVAPAVAERLFLGRCTEHRLLPVLGAHRAVWRLLAAHQAGLERVFEGYRWAAARPRPVGESVTLSDAEVAMLMRGEDAFDDATPRCAQCLTPLDVHPAVEAWVCPSCGQVTVTS